MMVDIEAAITSNTRQNENNDEIHSREISPTLRLPDEAQAESEHLKSCAFIEISIPDESEVTLALFDNTGQQLGQVLTEKKLPSGTHQVTFSPEDCNGTPCFYRLTVRSAGKMFVEVKRLH